MRGPRCRQTLRTFLLNISCHLTCPVPAYGGVFAQPPSSLFVDEKPSGTAEDSRLWPERSVLPGSEQEA